MLLAYQLATNGVKVRVLERHPDFKREFRGELMQRSVIEQLERAGILKLLVERGLVLPDMHRQMYVGLTRKVKTPGPVELGAVVSQPGLLGLLHELCSASPNYRMDFSTTALQVIPVDGRVVAVKTRHAGAEGRIDGDLFVVCSGRNTALRKACGLEPTVFETTADALWFRFDFSDAPEALPRTLDVHMFGKGVVVVLQPASEHRLHLAYSAPDDLAVLKKDLPELRRRLLPTLDPVIAKLVDAKLDDATESQVLKIVVDRLTPWHAPGIVFLGDAAHTMSPSGGQGLNVAIRDTFVAANHLIPALQGGLPLDATLFEAIEAERLPEITALQASQTRAGQMVMKSAGALHVMFTMLGMAMKVMTKKLTAGHGIAPPEPKYLTPVA
ncbi:MAG: FAD-dependent monooxygenase [Deltaproteobacteria bacterium]|nr:FAD-dependent monooxygenase [Deltaproteobacteria bacterium]